MQEVRGSSPLISTTIRKGYKRLAIERLLAFLLFGVLASMADPVQERGGILGVGLGLMGILPGHLNVGLAREFR
jgi:hypothetical protein